jgi:micrococcal nuclease
MTLRIFIISFVLLCISPYTHADERFSSLQKTAQGTVKTIIDPQTLQLKDGRLIALTGLDMPYIMAAPPQDDDNPYLPLVMRVLNDMLAGKTVDLYQTKNKDQGRINRIGHHVGHIVTKDGLWTQGTLLELGLARVRTTASNADMANEMYSAESKARQKKLGLWGDEAYQILTPDNAIEHKKSFGIIEGTIQGTAIRSNRIYLNFGKNWREDFTVSIAPENRKAFTRAKLDPLSWQNKTMRVRGWIESYNGPYVEITHPQAIEILD